MRSGSDVLNGHNFFDMHSAVLEGGRRKIEDYGIVAEKISLGVEHLAFNQDISTDYVEKQVHSFIAC